MVQSKKPAATLLVVDDDDSLRETLVFEFELRGFRVLSAASGNEGFRIVQNEKVDLVISDIRMPDGTGIDLLRNIKDRDTRIPVIIFITAFSDLTPEEAFEMGVEAVLTKPFDRKLILSMVERALMPLETRLAQKPAAAAGSAEPKPVQANYESWDAARREHQLHVGAGGLFTSAVEQLPEPGTMAAVDFSFRKDPARPIKGLARVEWRRTQESKGLPAGGGLSLEYLEPESRAGILEWIREFEGRAKIPRS